MDSLPTEVSGKPEREDTMSHILSWQKWSPGKGSLRALDKFEKSKEAETWEEGENGGHELISKPAEGF